MDIISIREQNIKAILKELRVGDNLTKKDIAQITSLSFSTVSNVCNELKDKGVLLEEKATENAVGRSPNKLTLQYDKFASVCISLRSDSAFRFEVLDFRNNVLFSQDVSLRGVLSAEEIAALAREIYDSAFSSPWLQGVQCVGIAVAAEGTVDSRTKTFSNTGAFPAGGTPIFALMEQAFGLPCHVDSCANYCALELYDGADSKDDLLYLHFSSVPCCSVICNGSVLRGARGHAMDLENALLLSKKELCPCFPGAGLSLSSLMSRLTGAAPKSGLLKQWRQKADLIAGSPGDYAEFLAAASAELGMLLGLLISLFDPKKVFIGGTLYPILPSLLPKARETLEKIVLSSKHGDTDIAVLDDVGAAMRKGMTLTVFDRWMPLG
jgi:predicted NBD/HSP70 family sugar kinase